MNDDIPGVSPIEVAWKRIDEMEKNMIIPKMPDGYYLMQDTGFWYILKDEGVGMKRLLDKYGYGQRFFSNSKALADAADYAQKHKDAGLRYDQEVGPDGREDVRVNPDGM